MREVRRVRLGTPRMYVAVSGALSSLVLTDLLVEDSPHRLPLLRASRRDAFGKRPGRQFGELLRLADVLIPGSRPLHDPQPQRIVVIRSRR